MDIRHCDCAFGGDTGVDADHNQPVIIHIDGYFVRTDGAKSDTIEDRQCVIGQWNGIEDDLDSNTFFFFESEADLQRAMIDDGTGEFVVTAVRRYYMR